jgi:UPF0716 family protein affecting phage T7 exclusion
VKWIIYLAILGFIEVAVIGRLHGALGLYGLMGLYLVTTIVGAVFLLIQLPRFRRSWKFMKDMEKGRIQAFKNPDNKPTAEELETIRPMLFFTLYFFAAVHIAIPGIVSDFVGMVMVIPVLSNRYLDYKINKMIKTLDKEQEGAQR